MCVYIPCIYVYFCCWCRLAILATQSFNFHRVSRFAFAFAFAFAFHVFFFAFSLCVLLIFFWCFVFVCYRYVSRRVSCNHNTVRTTARQADRLALAQPGSCLLTRTRTQTHTLTHSHSHSHARRCLRLRSFIHDDRQAQTRCCVFHTRCA